jgi:hypothetical protein
MKLILAILAFTSMAFVNSCSKSGDRLKEGTVELKLSECESGIISGDDLKLCFNTVVSDSRCPTNVVCIWQGTAVGRFTFTKNNESSTFDLSTLDQPPTYNKDTVLMGYKIEFVNLHPYPQNAGNTIPDSQRKAEIKITKQ